MQHQVHNPLINSSTTEWNNCRLLINKSFWTLQFCAVLINKFTFVPLSTQDGTGSGQKFWPCLSKFVIERVIKRFPLLYHNFWLQGCAVADDVFVTLSAVLDEVVYELNLWGRITCNQDSIAPGDSPKGSATLLLTFSQ